MLTFVALLGLSTALVCPDGGMCEDRDTCCQNTAGGYGCCPLPHVSSSPWSKDLLCPKTNHQVSPLCCCAQADCCSDHLHCCYQGTVCDLVHSKCVNKTVNLPLVTRLPVRWPLTAPQVDSHLLFTSSLSVDLWLLFVMFSYLESGLTPKMNLTRFTAI